MPSQVFSWRPLRAHTCVLPLPLPKDAMETLPLPRSRDNTSKGIRVCGECPEPAESLPVGGTGDDEPAKSRHTMVVSTAASPAEHLGGQKPRARAPSRLSAKQACANFVPMSRARMYRA
ncbi:hypothetical protein TRAPUB_3653 [Trametes pubescens]|uniref:Uncharacterized protein n=1 Tax=Trametes pubescens TaxID=154538 RepID=A0A1M2VDB7_TRAPU|nr:hypothetical protein TRAPUB_3653 [Trametes pubescens]